MIEVRDYCTVVKGAIIIVGCPLDIKFQSRMLPLIKYVSQNYLT